MRDTIYRDSAIDALKGLPTWWADEGGYYGGAQPPMVALLDPEDAVSAIDNLPSAQPEPDTIYSDGFCDGYKQGIKDAQSKIVCCKDCKYFETDYWVNSILTHEICAICECAVKPDGYCFMAERRER